MVHFVLCLFGGEGVEKDTDAAISWLKKAAEEGNEMPYYNLTAIYRNGDDVEKDKKLAMKYMKTAAKLGHEYAWYVLGTLYESGDVVRWDRAEAAKCYVNAAGGGTAEAEVKLTEFSKNLLRK
ncbi:MAG: sel1 repeat family protein [Bacteroidales bacterium]|nr:sel1 repeat family protein [Bacteroidales bacterium]